MQQLYPCFGLSFWELCAYNPAQPAPTYFTVGDAIAALGFMLAIQQLFKPIYQFRLRAYGLRILYLAWAVFLGALGSVVAMLLPNMSALAQWLVRISDHLGADRGSFNRWCLCRRCPRLAEARAPSFVQFDAVRPRRIQRIVGGRRRRPGEPRRRPTPRQPQP